MPDDRRFAVYFSHSWHASDVELNMLAWRELAGHCEILVDAPEEQGPDPPYYINRIEELLRRTDLFVSVLTHRDSKPEDFTAADSYLRCSPYMLFEIRLAERGEIPRLILYERSTGFRPPRVQRPWEVYIAFDRGKSDRLPEQRQWATVIQPRTQQWRQWATEHRLPQSYEQSNSAVMLLDTSAQDPLRAIVESSLFESGYEPVCCDPRKQRSGEALRMLREAGLVIAEFGTPAPPLDQLYAAAHVLGVPAIRMLAAGEERKPLPWVLSGEPGGYQNDIVSWKSLEDLPSQINPRIKSMFRLSPALRDAKAEDYLQSKRYSKFLVFLSHTLKPPERTLVEMIYERLEKRYVKPFEYHQVNAAGIDWQEALNDALQKTTHFVVLLSPDYELSPTCTLELDHIVARGKDVKILPFLIAGRSRPNPNIPPPNHHRLLSGDDLGAQADEVVKEVLANLDLQLETEMKNKAAN